MGSSGKESSNTTVINQTTTPEPTAEETAMNKAQLAQFQQIEPAQTGYYQSAYDIATQQLRGEQLPGYYSDVGRGISSDVIGQQATKYVQDAMVGGQQYGILDSGVLAKSIAKGVASDVLLPTAEYNSNLMLQLLGLATGQSTAGTQQFTGGSYNLGQRLAGLRSVNTSGTSTTTGSSTLGSNPFLGALGGAASGAMLGSVVPGIGTIGGAWMGGLLGGFGGR